MGKKSRTIKKIAHKKLTLWMNTIEDESVRALVKRDTILTGGSIASLLLGEPVNDYDIYFSTKVTALAVAKYYVDKFPTKDEYDINVRLTDVKNIKGIIEERVEIVVSSDGVATETGMPSGPDPEEIDETIQVTDDDKNTDGDYRPVFLSQNAITLSNKLQIIIRFYGNPDELHSNYDFIHACNWYKYADNQLYLNPEALESLLSKSLIYKGSLYPICSLFRLRKFIKRGWNISAGQILKIAWQISEIDLTDPEILKEQLTGVDMAYFHQLQACSLMRKMKRN